jgi:hypothetical protein
MNNRQLKQLVDDEVRRAGFEPEWKNGTRHKKCYVNNHIVTVLSHGLGAVTKITMNNCLLNIRRNLKVIRESMK